MGAAAVAAAKAVELYAAPGLIEFIVDGSRGLRSDGFWFMEMNTRLQVEHPVTEAITGIDLVELQFRVAAGEALPFVQEDVRIEGHAIEARLYAEDPANNFLPSTGPIASLYLAQPGGVRVDAGVAQGGEVTPYYDPMIAKVIALGATRDDALAMLHNALVVSSIAGPRTNRAFLCNLLALDEFRDGPFDTGTIDRNIAELAPPRGDIDARAVAVGAAALLCEQSRAIVEAPSAARNGAFFGDPWDMRDGFQLSGERSFSIAVDVEGKREIVHLDWRGGMLHAGFGPAREALAWEEGWVSRDRALQAHVKGGVAYVLHEGEQTAVMLHDPAQGAGGHGGPGDGVVRSPMHGKLVALLVSEGETVHRGQRLAIVEAMKMEHVLVAPHDGVVGELSAAAGQQVALGAKLLVVKD